MYIYSRQEWGARKPQSFPGQRSVNDEATIHWSGSEMTSDGILNNGSMDPRPEKPRKPGLKWYKLWRDPTTPKAQRRNISKVIRKYNADMKTWKQATVGLHAPFSPEIIDNEKRIVRSFQNYHMDTHGWSDIGYHYIIFATGNVYQGRFINSFGAHAYNANHTTGICFVMGPGDIPSPEMISAFGELRKRDGIRRYRGHRQVPGNATACPGPVLEKILRLPQGY